jgi:excisionase family DNA binding protein
LPLSIRQASDLLGVNPTTLRHWADQGQVRSFRTPGGHRRFSENDLLAVFRLENGAHPAPIDLPPHALARIRRRMKSPLTNGAGWVRELDDTERDDLRQHGRRLVAIASDYIAQPQRRAGLGQDAKEIGSHYGRVLAGHAMPFSRVLEAFMFFRDLLEEAAHARPAYREAGPAEREEFQHHLSAVLDKVLLGAVNGYEASR